MSFWIQIGNPKRDTKFELDDPESITDVLESMFASCTEDAIVCWQAVPVRMSYKYDLPYIVQDVLQMFDQLCNTPTGTAIIDFCSNTFFVKITMHWREDELECEATWESVSGGIEEVLNKKDPLRMSKTMMLNEWSGLFKRVLSMIREDELSLISPTVLNLIRKAADCGKKPGILYNLNCKN